jgi:hypothetical protein
MAIRHYKKISELDAITSASLNTYVAGVDNGQTVRITLDVLADGVRNTINTLDIQRLNALEAATGSYLTSLNGAISGSSQLTSSYDERYVISGSLTQTTWDNISGKPNGLISQSTDLSHLNSFTSSQNTLNTAFTNAISARLQTTTYNTDSASFDARIIAATNEQSFNGLISGSEQLTSSYDERYTLSGSVVVSPNTISSSTQITDLGFVSGSYETTGRGILSGSISYDDLTNIPTGIVSESTDLTQLNSFTSSQSALNVAFTNGMNGRLQTSSFNEFSASIHTEIVAATNEQSLSYLVTTSSFNSFTQSYNTDSSSFDTRINAVSSGSVSLINDIIYNGETFTIQKGTPLYVSGSQGANPKVYVADASDSNKMPVTYIAGANINSNNTGVGILLGDISGINLTGYQPGQQVYVAEGGGWSINPPSGSNSIKQFLGVIVKEGNGGKGLVLNPGPATLPNLQTGYLWVGNTNNQATTIASSSFEKTGRSIVSGSSQLTASYDSRYALSGSVLTSFSQSVDSRLDNIEAFSSSLSVLANSATKILDNASYTSATAWSGSYTGNGGTVKVEANFTLYSSTNNSTKTLYLYRDGIIVDSGSFYFNAANQHLVMPTLYYVGSTEIGMHTYSVGHNASSDISDYCTIVVTETFNSLNIEGNVNYVQVLGASKTLSTTNTNIISGSITTSGNPVQIMITGDANPVSSTGQWCQIQIYRDSSAIGQIIQVESSAQNENIPYCLNVIDTPAAGTYTYSMRMVTNSGGNFQYGEAAGPVLTAVELKTNTNLPSLNNTFTGTNTFNGVTRFGTVGGDEGGEIEFGVPQTNTTLSTRVVADVYRDRLRIFDGNTKGVYIDLSKAPTGVGGELAWKASGFVNAGVSITLDDIQARFTTSGGRSLEVRTTGANFTAMASAHTTYNNGSYTYYSDKSFTMSTTFGYPGGQSWGFTGDGDLAVYYIRDTTNLRFWRMTLMVGPGYNNNFITIERLH